jgi:ABC-type transport system involved in multi-copper enzyme maturation permease subunit
MGKGKPFLEVFTAALNEDYRFPILEIFAFLYALGTFVLAGLGTQFAQSEEAFAYSLVNSLSGLPLFIFVILILKNIAYGLGSDLEKGVIQTLLSYPLKRRYILTAKLLSALGIALLLYLVIQIFALFIIAPDVISNYFTTVFLTYLASLSSTLLMAGLVLILSLVLKRGGPALIVGIVLFFAFGIISSLVMFMASATGSDIALRVYAVLSPNLVLRGYYVGGLGFSPYAEQVWVPTFSEVLLYLGAGYLIVAIVFAIGYIYFDRKLGI